MLTILTSQAPVNKAAIYIGKEKSRFKPVNLMLACGFLFLCLAGQVCFAAAGTMKFSVSLDKSEYKPDEPVNAGFKLENKGKTAVYVNKRFYLGSKSMPKEQREVFLVVTSPSGIKLPCKSSYETGIPKSDYFQLLEPGKEAVSERKRDLRGCFDFSEPGVYKIAAVYRNACGKEIGLDVFGDEITSSAVSFKIVGLDPGKNNSEENQ